MDYRLASHTQSAVLAKPLKVEHIIDLHRVWKHCVTSAHANEGVARFALKTAEALMSSVSPCYPLGPIRADFSPMNDISRARDEKPSTSDLPRISILGIRGIPAAHGGFETFAERLAPYLLERNWDVTVYCQAVGPAHMWEDRWRGIRRVHVPVTGDGPMATMKFDWQCVLHAAVERPVCLTLGYNTASFCAWLRLRGVRNVINMDGLEWRRDKWSAAAKAWFWLNERAACWLGDDLVADHPEIERHLATRVNRSKISMIPYGADELGSVDMQALDARGLVARQYFTLIARPEPENSILEIVSGFSRRLRGVKLAVLGTYSAEHPYHRQVRQAASKEVVFLGAIYDRATLGSLRAHALGYLHGHTVGGTNPSLVEALGAGNLVIAHDNHYNRWVAGDGARYFRDADDVSRIVDEVTANFEESERLRACSRARHQAEFRWEPILRRYHELLMRHAPSTVAAPVASKG